MYPNLKLRHLGVALLVPALTCTGSKLPRFSLRHLPPLARIGNKGHKEMATPAADPLAGNTRYRKIKDINKGSFGFVVLAENLETREQVAIKFTRVE